MTGTINQPGTLAVIEKEVVVDLPMGRAWDMWTTGDGLERFFARRCQVDLAVGGMFEILFFPENPPGLRGAEGTSVLAIETPHRLAFTWNAPPQWPQQREQHTVVDVRFAAEGDSRTRVRLRHFGFGDGAAWDEVRHYFEGAWEVVLRRLQHSVGKGAIDWDDVPPELRFDGTRDTTTS